MRKKWMVAATVLSALVFVTLYLLGRETFHAEITTEATPERGLVGAERCSWQGQPGAQAPGRTARGLPIAGRRSASRCRAALPLPWVPASTERISGPGAWVWRVA